MARRCVRRKRVRVRGQGTAMRCAKFSGRASSRSSRKGKRRGKKRGKRRAACTQWKRVRSKAGGTVKRCVRFSKGRRRRGSFKRGHRPLNKGRKCTEWGLALVRTRDSRGRYDTKKKRVCRSYKASRVITNRARMLAPNAGPSSLFSHNAWFTD